MSELVTLTHVPYIQTDHSKHGYGSNSFGVFISLEDAEHFRKLGWNVREVQPRDGEPKPWLLLSVPSGMEFAIPQGTEFIDVEIRQYGWEVGDKSGVKLWAVSVSSYEN